MYSPKNVIVPLLKDLELSENIPCPEDDCTSIFKTWSNLQMHLVRHHRQAKSLQRDNAACQYACPIEGCKYNLKSCTKYFSKFKLLKQHYLKCHTTKNYTCHCGKGFSTPNYLSQHKKCCGKKFVCSCGWTYNSRDALMTHCKRKSHTLPEGNSEAIPKVEENTLLQVCIASSSTKSPRKPSTDVTVFPTHYVAAIALSELSTTLIIPKNTHIGVQTIETKQIKRSRNADKKRKSTQETQTAECKKPKISTETQTSGIQRRQRDASYRAVETQTLDLMPFLSSVRNDSFDHDNSLSNSSINNDNPSKPVHQNLVLFQRQDRTEKLCNNETQTDLDSLFLGDVEGTSSTETQTTDDLKEDLYSNMCTQTCSDATDLFDFSFVDIETQTAWPNL